MRPTPTLLPAGLAAIATLALVVAGCGADDDAGAPAPTPADAEVDTDAACAPAEREALDPASSQHVLGDGGGGGGLVYLSDPPTSGPHLSGPPLDGVLDEPLPRPRQVGHLEAGGVLIQHRDLDAAAVAELAALGGPDVAVAPNPDLPEPIVATAWLVKQTCQTVDVTALTTFVESHRGQGPGTDG